MLSGSKISLENNARLIFSDSSQFKAECTLNEPCVIQSNGSGFIRFGGETFNSSYVNFESLGSSSQPAIEFLTPSTNFPANLSRLNIINCKFNETGSVIIGDFLSSGGITPSLSLQFIRNTFARSRSLINLAVSAITDKDDSAKASRVIRGNVFEKTVRLLPAKQFIIEKNFFHGGIENLSSERWSSFNSNVIRLTGSGGTALRLSGDSKNNYWLYDAPQEANVHFIQPPALGDISIEGDIFEFTGTTGDGDTILLNSNITAKQIVSLKYSIVLPNKGMQSTGTLFSSIGNENVFVNAEHNTYFTGNQGAVVGEAYAGHKDLIMSFRSNIAWNIPEMPGGFILGGSSQSAQPIADVISASSLSHNAGYLLSQFYPFLSFTTSPHGVNDLNSNPEFVDPTRSFARWSSARGGSNSILGGIERLFRLNTTAPGAIEDLLTFIREGFFPRNPQFQNTAHDGTIRGAVQNSNGSIPVTTPTPVPGEPTAPIITPGVNITPIPSSTCIPLELLPPGAPPCTVILPPSIITPSQSDIINAKKLACRAKTNKRRRCSLNRKRLKCVCVRRKRR
jgi:hypothetical protein